MVHPVPVCQCLHSWFTGLSTPATSRISQQALHDPHCRAGRVVFGRPVGLKPCPSRTRSFCFSSAFNARSILRRDNPVASITLFIVVAPASSRGRRSTLPDPFLLFLFFSYFLSG